MNTFTSTPFSLESNDLIIAKVRAENSYGATSEYSDANTDGVYPLFVPDKPTIAPREGVASTNTQIEVQVTEIDEANNGGSIVLSYDIYWNQGAATNTWVLLANVVSDGSTELSYTHTTSITEGESYQFKYLARNVYGPGDLSDVFIEILAATSPTQVTDVTLILATTTVTVSWTAATARGTPVTGYKVTFYDHTTNAYREVDSFYQAFDENNLVDSTSFTIEMEQFGIELAYTKGELILVQVQAYSNEGFSEVSPEITTGLVYQEKPTQVLNLSAVSTDATTVQLSWDAITDEDSKGYSDIIKYEISYSAGTTLGTDLGPVDAGTAVTLSITGLTQGTTYTFAVKAVNDHGDGPLSDTQTILAAMQPDQMNEVTIEDDVNVPTSLKISWEAPTNTNGADITAYRVLLMNDLTSEYAEYTSLCDANALNSDPTPTFLMYCVIPMQDIIDTLGYSPGKMVQATAEAYNSKGWSTPSDTNTQGGLVKDTPLAVTQLEATVLSTTSVRLTWTDITSSPNNGYSDITSYSVQHNGGGSGEIYAEIGTPTTNTLDVSGLINGATYKFKVAGVNIYGTGVFSDTYSILVATIPAKMNAPNVMYNEADVLIVSTAPSNGGIQISSYTITFSTDGSTYSEKKALCDGSTTTFKENMSCEVTMPKLIIYGFSAGDPIRVKISATNTLGTSTESDVSNEDVIVQVPPIIPTVASLQNVDESTLLLSWNALTAQQDLGYAELLSYIVQWDAGNQNDLYTDLESTTELSYTITSLATGRTYAFKLGASNIQGRGEFSNAVSLMVIGKPSQMEPPMLSEVGTNVRITLTPPADNNSADVEEYRVLILDQALSTPDYVETIDCSGTAMLNNPA